MTTPLARRIATCLWLLMLSTVAAGAQDFRGRINGTVTDNTGAVLPGVTVTATSPALIQPQVQVSGADGSFRFLALPPGVYDIAFELAGFQSRQARRHSRRHQPDADGRSTAERRDAAGDRHGHRRLADRRHVDDGDGHQLHEGAADRNSQRPRHLGGHVAGAGPADDGVRRRRLAHRHADRLPDLRLQRPEPDQARRHRHHRGHRRQRRLLRLRQLRGVPGRRRRQRRVEFLRRRVDEHQRQVRRRSLHRQLVQRLRERRDDQRQRARQPAPVEHAGRGRLLRAQRADAAATRSIGSTTSTPTSAARCGSRRRGSSTAIG